MSSLKTLRTKETYREKIKTKEKGTQRNIFQSISNFENFCMEKHDKANIIPEMIIHKLKTSRIRTITVGINSPLPYLPEYVCNDCQSGTHSNVNHSMWIEGDEIRTITCKCDKCCD